MPADYTLPPDTRSAGSGNPPADMDAVVDALAAMGGTFNVLNASYSGGADPTGTADAYPPFQAALTAGAGAVIFVPPGLYNFSTMPLIPSGTIVAGAGWGTHLRMANGANLGGILNTGGNSNIVIRDMQLDGNKANQTGASPAVSLIAGSAITNVVADNVWAHDSYHQGIYWGNANKCHIRNCRATTNGVGSGFGFGFNESSPGNAATASWGNRITGCYTEANQEGGYSLYGSQPVSASYDNAVTGNVAYNEVLGINLYSAYGNTITGNKAIGCTTAGIQMEFGAYGNSVSGNTIDNQGAGVEGINLLGSTTAGPLWGNTVSGNTILNPGSIGISALNASGAVTGNTVSGAINRGIHAISCNGLTVTGNNSSRNGQDGIRLDGCTGCTVTGNTARNNSQATINTYRGIYLADASGTGTTYCTVTGNTASDDQTAMGGPLTANAASGQALLTVAVATAYTLYVNQWVTIGDVTDGTESNQVTAINLATGVITVGTNLAHTYNTANSATITGAATQKWGIFELTSAENFNTVTGNVCTGNKTGQISLSGVNDTQGLNQAGAVQGTTSGQYLCTPTSYAPGSQTAIATVSPVFVPLVAPSTTVAAGSNGGTISGIAAWATPSAGVLAVASTAGYPASGTLNVVCSGTPVAVVTYTGTSGGNTFTGCAYVSGGGGGTVATGGIVTAAAGPGLASTGSFGAPVSGSVVVAASFVSQPNTAAFAVVYGLCAHGTTTPMIGYSVQEKMPVTTQPYAHMIEFLVTGLTPGSSYNFDLMFCVQGTGTATIIAFGQTSTAPTLGSAGVGAPVVMKVQAV